MWLEKLFSYPVFTNRHVLCCEIEFTQNSDEVTAWSIPEKLIQQTILWNGFKLSLSVSNLCMLNTTLDQRWAFSSSWQCCKCVICKTQCYINSWHTKQIFSLHQVRALTKGVPVHEHVVGLQHCQKEEIQISSIFQLHFTWIVASWIENGVQCE